MYTASTALLDAMQEAGVSYIFANLGSDHPAFVEAVEHELGWSGVEAAQAGVPVVLK